MRRHIIVYCLESEGIFRQGGLTVRNLRSRGAISVVGVIIALAIAVAGLMIYNVEPSQSATVECSWSEVKACYNGQHNRCCPRIKDEG